MEEEEKCSRKVELWVRVSAVSLVVHFEEVTQKECAESEKH